MRRELFKGREVLATGSGQCQDCKTGVIRVLVRQGNRNVWHAAEIGNFGYVPHTCGTDDDPPLKRAA
jgi:hypothetical protein